MSLSCAEDGLRFAASRVRVPPARRKRLLDGYSTEKLKLSILVSNDEGNVVGFIWQDGTYLGTGTCTTIAHPIPWRGIPTACVVHRLAAGMPPHMHSHSR
jgi:hypothetical protein